MLFHVSITVRIPHNADPEKIKQLGAQEHERAKELQLQGKWVHLWRVAGRYANVSVFDVESSDELHEILSSLPLYPFMETDVTALCHHPGSLEPALRSQSG
jgi:muconolactone D-isomerase